MTEKTPKTEIKKREEKKPVYNIGVDGQAHWTGEIELAENKLKVKRKKESELNYDKLSEIRRKLREQLKGNN